LIGGIFSSTIVLAQVSVGVKNGEWIEFNVDYIGNPPDSYPEWVRLEVTNIQGTGITADLTIKRRDGTSDTNSGTFDLEIGVPELLLIPAGLEVSDKFYHEDVGEIEILWIEDNTYAGAKRTVVVASVFEVLFHWDKSTGILVQADQSTDAFTEIWLVEKTNMWHAQLFGLDSTIFYILIVTILAIIAIIAIFLYRRR